MHTYGRGRKGMVCVCVGGGGEVNLYQYVLIVTLREIFQKTVISGKEKKHENCGWRRKPNFFLRGLIRSFFKRFNKYFQMILILYYHSIGF